MDVDTDKAQEDEYVRATMAEFDVKFARDPFHALMVARSVSRGSAMFLADKLGPAPAYDIASKSADDIITEAAGELAAPIEPAAVRERSTFRIAFSLVFLGALMGGAVMAVLR